MDARDLRCRSKRKAPAHKCTLCYDRLKGGLEPACAKACPTESIQFGVLADLQARARQRVETLHAQGREDAYLYGVPEAPRVGRSSIEQARDTLAQVLADGLLAEQ